METMSVPYMSPTVVISEQRWFEIMDIVARELGSQGDKHEFEQWIALLVEAGYDTIDHLQTAVARELRNELGIPLRYIAIGTCAVPLEPPSFPYLNPCIFHCDTPLPRQFTLTSNYPAWAGSP